MCSVCATGCIVALLCWHCVSCNYYLPINNLACRLVVFTPAQEQQEWVSELWLCPPLQIPLPRFLIFAPNTFWYSRCKTSLRWGLKAKLNGVHKVCECGELLGHFNFVPPGPYLTLVSSTLPYTLHLGHHWFFAKQPLCKTVIIALRREVFCVACVCVRNYNSITFGPGQLLFRISCSCWQLFFVTAICIRAIICWVLVGVPAWQKLCN